MVARTLLTLASVALLACGPTPPPSSPKSACPRDVSIVATVLDDFHDAAAKADEARYFGHFSSKGVFLGTDMTERWLKDAFLAYAHLHFAKGKAWAFRGARRAIAFGEAGDIAYFDEDLVTEKLGPARGSGVLACEGEWKLLQYNLALTVPNDRFDLARRAMDGVVLGEEAPKTAAVETGRPNLSFMAGTWAKVAPEGRWEEHWTHPSATTMVGMGAFIAGQETKFFEHMTIDLTKSPPVMVVIPSKQTRTEFPLVAHAPNAATFENPTHDFPRRIDYRLEGRQLVVTLDGASANGSPRRETIRFEPAVTFTR